jgi:hypothetical protein
MANTLHIIGPSYHRMRERASEAAAVAAANAVTRRSIQCSTS